MKCSEYSSDFSAYLDGELAAARRRELEIHVGVCRRCADDLRSLRQTGEMALAHAGELELSGAIWDRVQSRIAHLPAPASRGWGWIPLSWGWRWAAATASILLVAAIGLGVRGYMSRLASEEELRRYVAEYIQFRETEAQRMRSGQGGASGGRGATEWSLTKIDENPFAIQDTIVADNPFKSEEQ